MWIWRRTESVRWEDRVTNKAVLREIGEEKQLKVGR